MSAEMETTGERVIESSYRGSPGAYVIYLMHMASYRLAEDRCRGKRVLELGCGTGYGAKHLAALAEHVEAIDVAADAIEYARSHYASPNLHFRQVLPGARLPYPDGSFDVVLSFQVLEHVADETMYLSEAARVLRNGGELLLVTPDRRHRLFPGQRPWNRWHLREYSMESLVKLVARDFEVKDSFWMNLRQDVAPLELRRYRLLKWASLPFTFPGVPERWRQWGLALMHRIRGGNRASGGNYEPDFGPEVIEFGRPGDRTVNLIVHATKRADGA